jgi:ABC-type uncharacterized transport system permease subunit
MPSGKLPAIPEPMAPRADSMNPALPGLAALALYLFGAIAQIRAVVRPAAISSRAFLPVFAAAVAAHAIAAWLVMNRPEGVDFGLFAMASLVALVLCLFVLVASVFQPVENLLMLVAPFAAATVAASLLFPDTTIPYRELPEGLLLHALLSVLAYTVLALAACQAVALALQERLLRRHGSLGWSRVLPPIQTMESLLFQQIWAGFVLLTTSIASGFLFLTDLFAQRVVHHTVLSIASWVVFLALLVGRHAFGWRGPTATRWTLTGFVLLVLAYFGSKFVIEVLLAGSA